MSEVVNLEELCTGIIDCPHSTPKWQDKGIPVIRNYNLKDGKIDCTNLSFVSEEGYKERVKRAIPEESDIIISREAPMGVVGIVPKGFQCCLGQRLVLLKIDKSKCLPKYLLYTLMSEYVQLQIRRINQTGSIVSNLNISSLRELKIPLHSFEEQKKIANILSAIDDKISLNNQINQELEAMAKTLYDYWFVQFDFPDQNGKPYKSSVGKMVYHPELKRKIPEGWGVEKLDDLGTIVGGSTPTKSISDNFTKGGEGYSWITPNDLSNNKGNKFIKNGEIDVTVRGLKDASLKLYPEGTVLMSSRAPVGYLAIATKELTTNQGFKSFIPDKKYDKNYIYYTLQNCLKVIEQNASGSTFKEISATVLKDIKISQPNLEIVKKFEIKVSSINNYIRDNEVQNQELTQLRDWLLPMLMNGQVKVE